MTIQHIVYKTYTDLACKCDENAAVILCVDPAITVTGAPYINGTIISVACSVDCHGETIYEYWVEYDDAELLNPDNHLYAHNISGILCVGCLTNYIDFKTSSAVWNNIIFVRSEAELIAAQSLTAVQVVVTNSFSLTQDVTVTQPLFIVKGCPITCTGHVLYITCDFTTGLYQCFIAVPGEVSFGNGAHWFGNTKRIYFEWFGALGNGIADDTIALQTAITAAYPSFIPIYACPRKTYMLSSVTLFDRVSIKAEVMWEGAPIFKSNAAANMFVLPAGPMESNIEICNIQLDGATLATSLIYTNFNQSLYIHDCVLRRASVGIDMSKGGYWCTYERNKIFECDTGILLSASCPDLKIYENNIKDCDNAILADALFQGTYTEILHNSLARSGGWFTPVTFINIQTDPAHNNNYTIIRGNAFEGVLSDSMIKLGEEIHAVIADNVFNGNANYGIYVEGQDIHIFNNSWIFNVVVGANIALTANSARCLIYPQRVSASGTAWVLSDAGSNNRVIDSVLRDTTLNRPTYGAGATAYIGQLYLDTTLDADGLPIWWNGTKWIKADGSDA